MEWADWHGLKGEIMDIKWKVGDRVSFAASPAPQNRTVYSGVIVGIEDGVASVVEDGYQATCGVRLDRLHSEGSYVITESGPRGVRWEP